MTAPNSPVPPLFPAGRATFSGPAPELLLAVGEVGRELAGDGSLEDRFALVLGVLERRLGAARSALYLSNAVGQVLDIAATHAMAPDELRPRLRAGVAGRVAESGQPIVVPFIRHDAMALSELADLSRWFDAGWSLVAVPVTVSGRPIGALCAYFRHLAGVDFGERLSVLEVVASLLGKAERATRAAPKRRAASESRPEKDRLGATRAVFEYANMVGESPAMRQVYELIGQVACTSATTLLRGESGTGKELVARAIHDNSPRASMPFIKVNCAALPEALFESELFGHERGAFTGAHARRNGRFELAEGGTLFLDEIGELALTTQAKLLRALQFREFERVGGTQTLHTDVRIIAATNADIERAVRNGVFREDFYYRINVFTITVPPLRDRRPDIATLAEYFLTKLAAQHERKIGRISTGALEILGGHGWPGNVRELENVIERAVVLCDGFVIEDRHLPEALRASPAPAERPTLAEAVERLERQMVEDALRSEEGCIAAAARALGTTERVVRYKATKLGVDLARFRR
ncbi:MAG TPA: sigma 54-interacting transcriptional regulator [Polyangiaceae bacterium]|nr:sigma 54-interacting transcriptional regulator [Polyangiaceae bacterium]